MGITAAQWEMLSQKAGEDKDSPVCKVGFCTITHELCKEPALAATTGTTYDRPAITKWIKENGSDPLNTNVEMKVEQLNPNLDTRETIVAFIEEYAKQTGTTFGDAETRRKRKRSRRLSRKRGGARAADDDAEAAKPVQLKSSNYVN